MCRIVFVGYGKYKNKSRNCVVLHIGLLDDPHDKAPRLLPAPRQQPERNHVQHANRFVHLIIQLTQIDQPGHRETNESHEQVNVEHDGHQTRGLIDLVGHAGPPGVNHAKQCLRPVSLVGNSKGPVSVIFEFADVHLEYAVASP